MTFLEGKGQDKTNTLALILVKEIYHVQRSMNRVKFLVFRKMLPIYICNTYIHIYT